MPDLQLAGFMSRELFQPHMKKRAWLDEKCSSYITNFHLIIVRPQSNLTMSKTRDDREALDAFIRAHSYAAEQGLIVKKLISHPVHARGDRGNAAAYFQFFDLKALEAHVSELPAGATARLHRHSCEALFYVLKGEGYTVIHKIGGKKRTIAWKEGDLYATPMSLWHQHFNASKRSVVRYLEITTIPLMKSLGAWSIESKSGEEAA